MDIDILISVVLGTLVAGIVIHSFLAANKPKTMRNSYLLLTRILYSLLLVVEAVASLLLLIEISDNGAQAWDYYGGIVVDGIGALLLLVSSLMFLFSGIFSLYYIKKDFFNIYATLFYALYLGLALVFISNNFFTMFIFWEFMVLTGYVLVIFEKSRASFEAGYKYLIMSSIGSLSVLTGLGLLISVSSTLNFGDFPVSVLDTFIGKLGLGLMILGFGVTAGFVGMNQWLADAHPAAPAPVSALLSGILVKGGIFAIFRTLSQIVPDINVNSSISTALLIVGVITMTEGNTMVIAQLQRKDSIDFKRILAYSTTVHLGFLLLIVGINSPLARIALVYHIINHALAKGLLFFISGYFIKEYGTRDIRDLKTFSLSKTDKGTMLALFVGLMSLGGLPLTGGFVSKFLIIVSVFNEATGATNGVAVFLFVILILTVANSAFAFGTYLWIIKELIFDTSRQSEGLDVTKPKIKVPTFFLLLSFFIVLLGTVPFLVLPTISSVI